MRSKSLRRILAALVLSCAVGACAGSDVAASPASNASVPRGERHSFRRAVLEIEQQWRAALLRRDTQSLGLLLNPDYLGISANGAVLTREGTLSQIASGTLSITQLALSDQKVRIFRQTAVVTSMAELHATENGVSLDGRYRYTHVYVRDGQGRWTIASFEASRVGGAR